MRRPLLLLAVLALACGAAWLWTHPGDLRLRIDPRSREVALILPREAQGLRTSAAVLRALAELAPPEQRETLRVGLGRATLEKAERATVGFIPGQPAELSENPPEVSVGGKVIPGLARVQLRGVPHGYLLVHAAPARALLETAARRRWLGRALIEAGAQAETATVTLPALVGQQHALELLYTGRRIDGEEAHRIGLADHLAPLDTLRSVAHDLALEIATSAPLAVATRPRNNAVNAVFGFIG